MKLDLTHLNSLHPTPANVYTLLSQKSDKRVTYFLKLLNATIKIKKVASDDGV